MKPFQSLIAAKNIAGDVSERMSYVQSGSTWVGKHIENIKRWTINVIFYFVGMRILPDALPFFFYVPEVVFHVLTALLFSVIAFSVFDQITDSGFCICLENRMRFNET
jgi:hypothetical protein